MPKPKAKHVQDLTLKVARDSDYCPIHFKRGKIVHRPGEKMVKHYQIKHPGLPIPDKYYTGPRDMNGLPIPEYEGKFQVGARVKVVGHRNEVPICPICSKVRPDMHKHYDKKHKSSPYPDGHMFQMHNELEPEIEKGFLELPVKGTVFGVTPAGWGGKKIPAIIHVRLDKPIDIHASRGTKGKLDVYYSRGAVSCLEQELRRFKPKS